MAMAALRHRRGGAVAPEVPGPSVTVGRPAAARQPREEAFEHPLQHEAPLGDDVSCSSRFDAWDIGCLCACGWCHVRRVWWEWEEQIRAKEPRGVNKDKARGR
jgi:hypothetical protein